MNAALSLPRGLRHPARYAPLFLPILPAIGAVGAADLEAKLTYLIVAFVMVGIGCFLSFGLGALLDRSSALVRKEAEQLRHVWLLGLFVSQSVAFTPVLDRAEIVVLVVLLFALLAALPFGIEFQQRTMPSLLCAPIDRRQLWRVKMSMLGLALLSQVVVLAFSLIAGGPEQVSTKSWIGIGIAGTLALAAWATVPLWTLLTRNLIAGLVFALAIPPVVLMLLGVSFEWLKPAGFDLSDDIGTAVVVLLSVAYLVGSPMFALRRWIRLEAPDLPEGEISGMFLSLRRATESRAARPGHWLAALLAKELRIQTVTLASLGVALLFFLAKPIIPPSVMSGDFVVLLTGLFAGATILFAGATPIAEERRLGTLDGHVLLPVSRARQWWIKLALSGGIAIASIALIVGLNPALFKPVETQGQLACLAVLFVFTFLASSAAPNSLRALILGIGLTGCVLGLVFGAGMVVFESMKERSNLFSEAMQDPEPWLAAARNLSAAQASALLNHPIPIRSLIGLGLAAAALPLLLALAASYRNFGNPAAGLSNLTRQFFVCTLAVGLIIGAMGLTLTWLQKRSVTNNILLMAWKRVDLERRLSPAQRRLWSHVQSRDRHGLVLSDFPEYIHYRHRQAAFGTDSPPAWSLITMRLPLTQVDRRRLINDGDIPEDLREALRQEAITAGDTNVPTAPGRPTGPWPKDPPAIQMPAHLMRRYGLVPLGAELRVDSSRAGNRSDSEVQEATNTSTPPPTFQMSPELMKRYGLTPPPSPTNNPPPNP